VAVNFFPNVMPMGFLRKSTAQSRVNMSMRSMKTLPILKSLENLTKSGRNMLEGVVFEKPFLVIKKPKKVTAFYVVDHSSLQHASSWIRDNGGIAKIVYGRDVNSDYLEVQSPRGPLIAYPGDYIIMGIDNEFYTVKSNIFEETYQIVG